ncbi:MBL fold metallo-hydrolase [Glaciihabitans sp. INWT7]|uniref:MBL fold metallo-hydrolase n=1 Tax=Glaciihabitans sp. INWT7 TaxID=2596912 RepID=UPI0016268D98|nr:MBL fold metallo-hydrolase [Glaciihabitans sp. INWT7]
MIEPLLVGEPLLAEIASTAVLPGSLAAWRLGQAGFILKFPTAVIAIDPYLGNHCEAILGFPFDHRRLTRSPLDPAELDILDLLICTHNHPDHLEAPTVRALGRGNANASVVAPPACRQELEGLGWSPSRIQSSVPGKPIVIGALTVTGFAVPHEDFEDENGNPYQGFLISDGEVTVAHLGDLLDDIRVREILSAEPIDLLAVPINGRDKTRSGMGFAGNLTAEEATELAWHVGAVTTIPMHYDMFAQNVDLDALARFRVAAVSVNLTFQVAEVGEKILITRAAGRAE